MNRRSFFTALGVLAFWRKSEKPKSIKPNWTITLRVYNSLPLVAQLHSPDGTSLTYLEKIPRVVNTEGKDTITFESEGNVGISTSTFELVRDIK